MGCGGSKKEEDDGTKDKVFRFQDIYYDEQGNLRVNRAHARTKDLKEKELRDILNIEEGENLDSEDVTWYIMDAAWIADWFAYVHYESDTAPNPGPCRNERLLIPDYELNQWVPRKNLIMASKKRSGDYRRVSRKTWELYSDLYPGSGPTITTIFKIDDNFRDSGLYDTSGWRVEEFRLPPRRGSMLVAEHEVVVTSRETAAPSTKDASEVMEDQAITRNMKAQMDFLGTRKIADDEEKKKNKKKKRVSK